MIDRKKIVKIWEDGNYVRWEYADGSTEGAYNLMYQNKEGWIETLKQWLEKQMQIDYSQIGTDSKMEIDL